MLSRPRSGYKLPPICTRDINNPDSKDRPSLMVDENVRKDWSGESREQLLTKSDIDNMLPEFVRRLPRAYLVPPRIWRGGIYDFRYISRKRKRDHDAFSVKSLYASLMAAIPTITSSHAARPTTSTPEEDIHNSTHFSRKRKRDCDIIGSESLRISAVTSADSSEGARSSTSILLTNESIESQPPSPYFSSAIGVNYAVVWQHWELIQKDEVSDYEESDDGQQSHSGDTTDEEDLAYRSDDE